MRSCSFGKRLSDVLTLTGLKPSVEVVDSFNRFLSIHQVNVSLSDACKRVEVTYGGLDIVAAQWIQWFVEIVAVILVPIGLSLALHRWYRAREPSIRDIPQVRRKEFCIYMELDWGHNSMSSCGGACHVIVEHIISGWHISII